MPVDIPGRSLVVVTTRRLGAIDPRAPFDHVEVELQNPVLAEYQFGHRDQRELGTLSEDRAARAEKEVFYQLLRKGGPSAKAAAFQIVLGSDFDRVPIKSVMLVEACVFRGDDRMLEIGRDLAERNEFISDVIGRAVNPRLQAALHRHRGSRWVDPSGSHKYQRSENPKKRRSDDKPSKEGSKRDFPEQGLCGCVGILRHVSE